MSSCWQYTLTLHLECIYCFIQRVLPCHLYAYCYYLKVLTKSSPFCFSFLQPDVESDWSPIHDAAFNGRVLALQKLIAQVKLVHCMKISLQYTVYPLRSLKIITCMTNHRARVVVLSWRRLKTDSGLIYSFTFGTKLLTWTLFTGNMCESEHSGQGLSPPRSVYTRPHDLRQASDGKWGKCQ